MSNELKKTKERIEKVTLCYKCQHVIVCLACIFLLACVVASIYVITDHLNNTKRSLDAFNSLHEEENTQKIRNEIIRKSSRVRRSLLSPSGCEIIKRSSFANIINSSVVAKYEELCNKSLNQLLSRNASAIRDKVFFPINSHEGLKILLRQEIIKELLKSKHGQLRNNSPIQDDEEEDDDSYAPSADLYIGGYVHNKGKPDDKHQSSKEDDRNQKTKSKEKIKSKQKTNEEVDQNHKFHTKDVIKNPDIDGVDYPVFPSDYHASGLVILPHSGIAEPFEIWYAPSQQKSRIDYYYGTDKTYQLGDNGKFGGAYKYVPMYNDKDKGFDGCWAVSGTENRPVVAQIITPNITWFQYNGTTVYTGTLTTRWTYQYYAFGMKNSQTVWITKAKPNRPIRYEMFGFDMMLGSYYDHYVIEYISFEKLNYLEETFRLPEDIKCFHWGVSLQSSLHVNPMQEFAAFSPDKVLNITALYERYKAKKNEIQKKEAQKDDDIRKHMFRHHSRLINSHNRKNATFKLKPNPFLTLTHEELEAHHGQLEKDPRNHAGIKQIEEDGGVDSQPPDNLEVPEEIDWREYGAVSHVKGQGICGACYAFTAAGAAEGAWYRKTGRLVEVSSQQILDCSWGYGNHGCKGGHYATALSWIYTHGISTDKSYGKFLAQEGYCHFNDTWFGASIDGFSYIQPWNKTALKIAVWKYGPIAVSINTRPLTFKFYSHGIYNDPKCVSNQTTHSALVVGYGKEDEEEYWIVKNSWSNTWGENGYMKVSMKDHLCGITEYPVAVVVYRPQFQMPHKSKANLNDRGLKIHPKHRYAYEIDDDHEEEKEEEESLATKIAINPSKIENDINDNGISKKYNKTKDNDSVVEFKIQNLISMKEMHPLAKFRPTMDASKLRKYNSLTDKQSAHVGKSIDNTSTIERKVSDLFPNMFSEDADNMKYPEDDRDIHGLSLGLAIQGADKFDSSDQNKDDGEIVYKSEGNSIYEKHKFGSGTDGNDKNYVLREDTERSRINATITLFRDGILNKSLFDALSKEEKEEEGKSVERKIQEIERERKTGKKIKESEEEKEKALKQEKAQEVDEMQKEERKKGLEQERKEELAELEKEKNTTRNSTPHRMNVIKPDGGVDVQKIQQVLDEHDERKFKEFKEIEVESNEDHEKEQKTETDIEKEDERKKEMEEKQKIKLEEEWKAHLEKERRENERKLKASLSSERNKSSNEDVDTDQVRKAAEEKEKLQSEMLEKEEALNKEIESLSGNTETDKQQKKSKGNSNVAKRKEKLLSQQKEIRNLIKQLEKLHVTGEKKSETDIPKNNKKRPSVDPERIGLYSTVQESPKEPTERSRDVSKKQNIQGELKGEARKYIPTIKNAKNGKTQLVKGQHGSHKSSNHKESSKRTHQKGKTNNKGSKTKVNEIDTELKEINKMGKMINMLNKMTKMKKTGEVTHLEKAEIDSMDLLYSKIYHDLNKERHSKS